jgi:phospholipid transport system substrate-binding protein
MRRFARLLGGLCVLALGSLHPVAGAIAGPASDLIQGLNAKFIEVMKNAQVLGYEGRYKALAPALADAYDFPEMTRVTVGRYWRDLTDAQKQQLTDAFQAYSTATYAARFNGFSGEKFEILGEEPAPAGSLRVNNQIVQGSGEPVRIDYLLRDTGGRLRIIDVYLKAAVSELAVRRSEFTAEFAKAGFDGLLAMLKAKVAQLEKDSAAPPAN